MIRSPLLLPAVFTAAGFSLAAFACGGDDAGPGPITTLTAGSGGATTTSSTVASTTGAVSVTSSGSGGAFVCDPPATPGSLWELEDEPLFRPGTQPMCAYRGDVIFMFNAAAL